MRAAIVGFGRLGQSLQKHLLAKGHDVVFKTKKPLEDQDLKEISAADVIYVLVPPKALTSTCQALAPLKVPVVIGTTNWEEKLAQIKELFQNAGTGMLYGANFSLSMMLMKQSLEKFVHAASKAGEQFTITGFEHHHSKKVDGPSGTAVMLHKALKNYSAGTMESFDYKREGDEKGLHEIRMENNTDMLKWVHRAKDRATFAKGALAAGLWLLDKKGVFTFEHFVETLL